MDMQDKSYNLQQTLLKTIPFGLQIVDLNGTILYSNENMNTLTNENSLGKKCWVVYKDNKQQCSDCPLKIPLDLGLTKVLEVNGLLGEHTFLIHHTKMVFQNTPAVLEIFQDITSVKHILEANQKLLIAVEQSPATIIITDLNGNIEYVNKKFTQVTGYSFQEIIGKNPRILKSGEKSSDDYSILWKTLLNKKEWRGEFVNKKKNGDLFRESALISPILNSVGAITHFIAIKEDITNLFEAKKTLIQSEKRYHSLFNNMLEGFAYCKMIYKDNKPEDFIYLEVNEKFTELTGLKNVTGKRVTDVIPGIKDANYELLEFYGRVALTGIPEKFEIFIKELGIWFLVSAFSFEKNYFAAIFENITPKKQSEESLKKMSEELILQNTNLEQFTYIISHNLRSPVANITGIVRTLMDYPLEKSEYDELMKILFSSVQKLDDIIIDLNDILHIKKEVTEKKDKVVFSELVLDITNSITSLIQKENVFIKTDFSDIDEIFSLKSFLHSIFYNLISNSIKYKRPDVSPRISIKSLNENNKIILIFSDNGMGIDLSQKGNQLFGLFKRFHTTHTEI
ncbi:MAG TPA: PAS domain S-box protein, partial [Ignavibacteriaceae bacterium]|nr:PAS domain S-box protein [Ignavibacteriaceae bacterium]